MSGRPDGTIYVSTKIDESGFEKGMRSLRENGTKNAAIVGAAIAGIGTIVAGIALKGGLDRALNIDDARAKLRGLGYDAATIEQVMNDAIGSVTDTAYGLDSAMTVAVSAMAAGISEGEELETYLRGVADASTIAGTSMDDMGYIFNKVQASGKVTGETLRELETRGIPVVQWLAEEYGVSAEEMRKMVSSGEVDALRFRKAMDDNIGGAALESGETVRGSWDNTMAALSRAGAAFLTPILGPFREFLEGVRSAVSGFVPVLAEYGEKIGEFIANFDFSELVEDFEELDQAWQDFVSGFKAGSGAFGTDNPFAKFGMWLEGFLDKVGLKKFVDDFQGFGQAWDDFLAGFKMPEMGTENSFAVLGQDIREIWDAMVTFAEGVKTTFAPVIETLRESFDELMNSGALDAIKQAFTDLKPLLTFVAQVIGAVLAVALGILIGIINGVIRAIGPLISAFGSILSVVGNVFKLIKGIITGDGEMVNEAIEGIKDGIVGVFSGLYGAIKGFLTGFVDGVVSFFTGLYRTLVGNSIIPDMIRDIVRWFAGLPRKAVAEVRKFASQVAARFREVPGMIRAALSGMASVGANLVTGLWNGINDKFSWLTGRLREFATNVTDRLKSFFGIKSPSVLLEREVGMQLALGVGKGFTGTMSDVTGDMARTVNSEVGRLSAGVSGTVSNVSSALTINVDARGATDPDAVRRAGVAGIREALEDAVVMGRLRTNTMGAL